MSMKRICELHKIEPTDYGTTAVTIFIENEIEP